jgi:anti-anti-sigma factor
MPESFSSVMDGVFDCGKQKVAVIRLAGSFDGHASAELDALLKGQEIGQAQHIILDMAKVDYLNSAGLRLLLKFRKKAVQAGGRLKLAAVPRVIRENVLEALSFSPLMDIFRNVNEAMESVGPSIAASD